MLDELVGKERFPSHPVHLIAVWDMLRPLVSTVWHHDCLRSAKDAKVMSPCQSQHVFGMRLELGHFVPAQLGMRAMTAQNHWAKNCMFSGEAVQLETCTHCLLYIFLFVQRQVSRRYEPRAWHRRKKVSRSNQEVLVFQFQNNHASCSKQQLTGSSAAVEQLSAGSVDRFS